MPSQPKLKKSQIHIGYNLDRHLIFNFNNIIIPTLKKSKVRPSYIKPLRQQCLF